MIANSRALIRVVSVLSCLGAAMAPAAAQTTVNRPIRIIVPYVPGGGTDTLARQIAPYLADEFKQQVLVDNRPGASSTIGTQLVAKAPPDGEIIGMIDAAFLINPSLLEKLPYDAQKDFAPITLIATLPLVLLVHPTVPAKTVRELVALAKQQPGKLHYGSAGNGSAVHLAGEQFRAATGTVVEHIPYKGSGQAVTDLLGGQIEMAFTAQSSAKPHMPSGRVRALAVTTLKRTTVLPDVPTFTEAGYPGVDAKSINGLIAPAGTPRDYISRVHRTVAQALNKRELQERLTDLGYERVGNTPEEFTAYIRSEIAKWGRVVKASGAKAAM